MIVAMRPQTAFIPSLLQQAFRDVSRGGVKLRSYISHDVPYLPPKFCLRFTFTAAKIRLKFRISQNRKQADKNSPERFL